MFASHKLWAHVLTKQKLVLTRATHADVKKKTEAKDFYTLHWDTFEKGPIDADGVLEQLAAEVKNKEAAFAVIQDGLGEVLS